MSVVMKFWSRSLYSIFPSGLILTLRDISIVTDLPLIGNDSLGRLENDLSLPSTTGSSTTYTSYIITIRHWVVSTRVPTVTEHVKLLWVLICRFIFFPNLGKPTMKISFFGQGFSCVAVFCQGIILLTSIYHALNRYIVEVPYHKVGGALWFV